MGVGWRGSGTADAAHAHAGRTRNARTQRERQMCARRENQKCAQLDDRVACVRFSVVRFLLGGGSLHGALTFDGTAEAGLAMDAPVQALRTPRCRRSCGGNARSETTDVCRMRLVGPRRRYLAIEGAVRLHEATRAHGFGGATAHTSFEVDLAGHNICIGAKAFRGAGLGKRLGWRRPDLVGLGARARTNMQLGSRCRGGPEKAQQAIVRCGGLQGHLRRQNAQMEVPRKLFGHRQKPELEVRVGRLQTDGGDGIGSAGYVPGAILASVPATRAPRLEEGPACGRERRGAAGDVVARTTCPWPLPGRCMRG